MIHKVDLTGDYDTTIYDVARRLLAEGADPKDMVETYRDRVLSMKGSIGWLANWRVEFAARGPRLVPCQGGVRGSLAPKTAGRAIGVPEVAIVGGNGLITGGG